MSEETLAEAYKHCESIAREYDRDRWIAALFAPADRRPDLHALSAFFFETGRIKSLVREPLMGEMRLTWWREAIDGERVGEAKGHPVAAPLIETILRRQLPVQAFEDYLLARRDELYREEQTHTVYAPAYAMAARVLETRGADAAAEAAGRAAKLAEGENPAAALPEIEAAEAALGRSPSAVAPAFAPLATLRLDVKRRLAGKGPAPLWRRQIAMWIWGRSR